MEVFLIKKIINWFKSLFKIKWKEIKVRSKYTYDKNTNTIYEHKPNFRMFVGNRKMTEKEKKSL